jgi:hypothetical protein
MNRFQTNPLRTYSIPETSDGGTFNPIDLISGKESIDYASLESQILSNYLPLSGGTVGNLAVDNGFYIGNQQQQNFNSTELAKLNNVDSKTTRLTFTGSKTTLSGEVEIDSLRLSTKLPMSDIGNGTTSATELSYLNGVTQPIQTKLNDLQTQQTAANTIATNTSTTVATQAASISGLQTTQTSHTSTLGTHTSSLQTLATKTTDIAYASGVTTITNLQTGNVNMTLLQNVTQDVQAALNTHTQDITFIASEVTNLQTDTTALGSVVQTHIQISCKRLHMTVNYTYRVPPI